MPSLARLIAFVSLLMPLLVSGCATTSVETSGATLQQPLCRPNEPKLPVAIYWQPQWREDQKEPLVREALAQQGIERFVSQHPSLSVTELKRLPAAASIPTDSDLIHMAASVQPQPERVVLIVVRELGPRLLIGLPVLIEGGTEVVIEVRVINLAASEVLANSKTQWRNGGTFVIKGVKSLDKDMSDALTASLMREPASP